MRFKRLSIATVLFTCMVLPGCSLDVTNCFVTGTQIATPNGPVLIEDLSAGDAIISIDPITSEQVVTLIHSIRSSFSARHLIVKTTGGRIIEVTEHHPFLVSRERMFRSMSSLGAGEMLWTWSGESLIPDELASITPMAESATVYHLLIDRNPHTFLANGFLVHNKLPPVEPVSVSVTTVPDSAGWILVNDEDFVGQVPDTLLTANPFNVYKFEAVARFGWRFVHWEGETTTPDSIVTNATFDNSTNWIRCVFDTAQ